MWSYIYFYNYMSNKDIKDCVRINIILNLQDGVGILIKKKILDEFISWIP